MSVEEMVQGIWNEARPEGRTAVPRAILRLLSLPYGAAVALRNHLYDRELLRPTKLPCPVVSVGNLTVGGTGKTPTVILLAALLKEHGYRPAVLSRGYGGHAKASVNVVSDGNRVLLGWREAGDEPVLIAGALPGIPVLTGPKRSLTGKAAVERFGADILILDDAFQHRSLFRDIDIVLIDAARPFGNGFSSPGGRSVNRRKPCVAPASSCGRETRTMKNPCGKSRLCHLSGESTGRGSSSRRQRDGFHPPRLSRVRRYSLSPESALRRPSGGV